MTDHDVLICGCGPVGALLANLLRDAGHSVAVFERYRDVFQTPRAMVLDDESLRILNDAGMLERLRGQLEAVHTVRFTDPTRRTLLATPMPPSRRPYGHAVMNTFYQPGLERSLREKLTEAEGASLFLGWEIMGIDDRGDEVVVRARDVDTGETAEHRGRFLVGCDGGRSFTAAVMGVERRDLGFSEEWIVMDTRVRDERGSSARTRRRAG